MLEELDLLQQQTEEDTISLNSLECTEDESIKNKETYQFDTCAKAFKSGNSEIFLSIESTEKNLKHVRSLSDVTDFARKYDIIETNKNVNANVCVQNNGCVVEKIEDKVKEQKTGEFSLKVDIIQTGL